jgi:hypothetical protein
VVAELRLHGFGQANTYANFSWLPAGAKATELAAALERSGIMTRCVPDAGVRVTVGTPDENDRFLEAFGRGELVPGLAQQWQLPTGPAAARVHGWVQHLVNPDLQARIDLASATELLARCEVAILGSASPCQLQDVPQILHATADVIADAPAEALPRLELELSELLV